MARRKREVNNIVVISDLHCGCRMGLCPPEGMALDDGGPVMPSKFQRKLWSLWEQLWGEHVPKATHGEPFAVVVNGDAVDGVHHGSTTQMSHNLEDQSTMAEAILRPVVDACEGKFYVVRGTEAHVGKSAAEEERLAKRLGAKPNAEGQRATWDLWTTCGDGLVHFLHHVGTTSSSAHEASAVNAELTAEYVEAARWNQRPPNIIIRSHRHSYIHVQFATDYGIGLAAVTPGWQGKTPFAWKIARARLAPPQFGALVVRHGDRRLFVDPIVWITDRSPVR